MISLRLTIAIITLIGLSVIIVARLSETGLFSHIEDFNVENCQSIATVPGCEDLQVDLSQDVLYLSVHNWAAAHSRKPTAEGGIYTLDLKDKNAKLHHASIDQPSDFFPHGIHLYEDPQTGEKTLFVVNHRKDDHSIEIFDVVDNKTLKHRETLTHELLVSPNDIFGTGKRSFYVSQDTKHQLFNPYLPIIVTLGMEEGSLVYYDGNNFKSMDEHIHFANGIAISHDKKTLYLAETCQRNLRVYNRDPKTGDLKFNATYKIYTSPDNIDIDSEGNIWIAGISNTLAFTSHQHNPAEKPPVEILKARFEGEKLISLDKVLSSSGKTIAGITGVTFYDGKVIVAGPMQTEVKMCSRPKESHQAKPIKDTDL